MHDDAHWVHQTLSGGADAFHHLINTYQQPICSQILATIRNHWDAEKLTNDVFLKAHQHLDSLREPRCFRVWLRHSDALVQSYKAGSVGRSLR